NHCCLLLLRLLRCFSSARSRIIHPTVSRIGCRIRKSPDPFAFADPRCLSQLVASFFASGSLGIPRVPLSTFFTVRPFCYRTAAFGIPLARECHCCLLFLSLFLFSSNMSKNVSSGSKDVRCGIDDGLPPSVPNPPIFAPESVENNGFEPLTPCVQGRCSSQLS